VEHLLQRRTVPSSDFGRRNTEVSTLINLFFITLILVGPAATTVDRREVTVAKAEFAEGNYADAIKTLLAANDFAPDDSAIDYWLSRSYYEERDYDQAIAYGEKAVKVASQNSEYYRWLGRAYGAKAEQTHSFFLARKVKNAFEAAVNLAPRNINARRDLMQYLVEAPWIVGGNKEKAKQQIDSISQLNPVQGRLAQAAFWAAQKKWKEAEAEYLRALDQHPDDIEAYMEVAEFFADRKDANNLDHVLTDAGRIRPADPRVEFYRAVVLVLRRTDLGTAEDMLLSYIAHVPQRSDYPSQQRALRWLQDARS
jgi:tetratricopeptide (TPR) repeat protein